MTKRFGFTLAEVLITLGIIGVVAAMTIPTLVANTNGAKFRSQFKKTLSTLNQAGLMAQAQYDFDYAGVTADACTDAAKDDPTKDSTVCALLNGTLTGYTAHGTTAPYADAPEDISGVADTVVYYSLADGSIVAVPGTTKDCSLALGTSLDDAIAEGGALAGCIGYIDVNGITLPNAEVNCSKVNNADVAIALTPGTPCEVKNNATNLTDIFPVVFHDATVEPATNAAKYVLTSTK